MASSKFVFVVGVLVLARPAGCIQLPKAHSDYIVCLIQEFMESEGKMTCHCRCMGYAIIVSR